MSAMPAEVEAEPRSVPTALSPTTVRPRLAGPRLLPVTGQPPRTASPRPRAARTRWHPVGVRACSAAERAEWAGPPVAVAAPRVSVTPRGAAAPGLRLTRRGRIALAVCAAAAASLFGLAAAGSAQASDHGTPAGPAGHSMTRVVVQPGQTLWSIAVRADPHADPRLVIQQIMAANALPAGGITAGQRLLVPSA